MRIDIAVKKVKELTDDELYRYAQLCEIEIIDYKESSKNFPINKLQYKIAWLRHLQDQKTTFLYELERRKHDGQT